MSAVPRFKMQIIVNGRPKEVRQHKGEVFCAGKAGKAYVIRVWNRTPYRALAVPSVDGLSTMDGQPAAMTSGGYIVPPNQYIDIPGWRLNNQEVARFEFGKFPESYAAQIGRPDNIGVIGVMIFEEHRPLVFPAAYRPSASGGHSNTLRGLGTTFGQSAEHRVVDVEFQRQDRPAEVLTIRYDTRENLKKLGINFDDNNIMKAQPFPADNNGSGCVPPLGWRSNQKA